MHRLLLAVTVTMLALGFSGSAALASHTPFMTIDAAEIAAITVPGIVPQPYELGTYLSGGFGVTGTSPPDSWAFTLDPAFDPSAANSLDYHWIQGRTLGIIAPTMWDLTIASDSVLVFPSIDHGPMSPAPYEALEFTVWGSNDPAAMFPESWTRATLSTVYADGWIDVGAAEESDDFASLWTFGGGAFQFVIVYANRSIEITPGTASENSCFGEGVWCSLDHEVDAVGRPAPAACPLESIQIDDSLSNEVVSGSTSGLSPCDAVLEINNERGYWVNYTITASPDVNLTPAGGVDNLYDEHKVLGPNESVHYLAEFSGVGQTVIVILDPTTVSGDTARRMNLVEAIVDGVGLFVPGAGEFWTLVVEFYPELRDAFGSMVHLEAAAIAYFSEPPDIKSFMTELRLAVKAGELELLGETLEELGFDAGEEIFKLFGQALGKIYSVGRILWDLWGNTRDLHFKYPSGFVVFTGE